MKKPIRIAQCLDNIKRSSGINNMKIEYIQSGIKNVDDLLKGFKADSLSIVAARPAMGVNLFGYNLCRNIAGVGSKSVLYVSFKNTEEYIVARLLSIGQDHNLNYPLGLLKINWNKSKDLIERIIEQNLFVSGSQYSCNSVLSDIENHIIELDIDIVIIDSIDKSREFILNEKIEESILKLNEIARDNEVAIIMTCTLDVFDESVSSDPIPGIKDLDKIHPVLDHAADLCLFLHRPIYYEIDPVKSAEIGMRLTEVYVHGPKFKYQEKIRLDFIPTSNQFLDHVPTSPLLRSMW